jgi:hypothetical protein
MITKEILISVVQSDGMEPVIQIYDPDKISTTLIKMNLEAAHKLLEDLFNSIELVESLMPSQNDITH